MRHVLVTVLAALTLACAAHRPPRSIPMEFARNFGCNPQELQERADRLRDRMDSSTQTYVPQVGWTVCDLIAHNGKPSSINRTTGYGQAQLNFYYEGNVDLGYVSLEPRGGEWVVAYVSW